MRFRAFKWSVYGLLALNFGLFLLFETPVEALDSLGWLVLLGVLERETSTLGKPRSGRERAALRAAQGPGYAVVVLAWAGYAREGMWLDFANASLWLGVVLALAFDVRSPRDGARACARAGRGKRSGACCTRGWSPWRCGGRPRANR